MADTALPDNSELTREDFTRSGWREILEGSPITHYSTISGDFGKASKEAQEYGNLSRAKILRLLAETCSMRLTNKSPMEPYAPGWQLGTSTSATPDTFAESDINFLAEVLDDVDHPLLKGRLSDILWLEKSPPEVRFALEAIDNYRSLDLNTDTWVTDIGDCWRRALVLATMLETGAGERIKIMGSVLMEKFDTATKEDGRFGRWIAETMGEFKLGGNAEGKIAEKLEALGQEFDNDDNFPVARAYYRVAGDWYAAGSQNKKQIDMLAAVAEGWAQEAGQKMSSDNPSTLAAADFYLNSIQSYREIPRSEREARQINKRIPELMSLYEEAGKLAVDEMVTISTPGVDITEMAQQARNAVAGKEPPEALNSFASLHHSSAERLREISLENLKDFPFAALISRTTIGHDARVVAKTPGMTPSGSEEENEPAIWAQMIQEYDIVVGLAVRGRVLPALKVMHIEHRFREADFIKLARKSPAVPPGREVLLGKALFNGYEYDFAIALHLLTPQIEHMVRYRLKAAGIDTLHTDRHGIQDEKGLSSLVESPEFGQVFDKDLAFEIRALFCDHLGANLRNNVSHGPFTSQECHSAYSVYAWWLGLKIVFRQYWAAYQRHVAAEEAPGETPETDGDPSSAHDMNS